MRTCRQLSHLNPLTSVINHHVMSSSVRYMSSSSSSSPSVINVPSMGDSITEGTISSWTISEGSTVNADEVVCVIETDKVSIEVRAPYHGTVMKHLAQSGDEVAVGSPLFEIQQGDGSEQKKKDISGGEGEEKKASGQSSVINVPSMGDSITEGTISSWTISEGSTVNADEVVCVIETDKVSIEVRAPSSGVVTKHLASPDQVIAVGAPLFEFIAGGQGKSVDKKPSSESVEKSSQSVKSDSKPPSKSPSQSASTPSPSAPSSSPVTSSRTERRVPMSRMRIRIAERLKDAQNTAASLTTFNEIDMSALMNLRSKHKEAFQTTHDVKLGFMSAFVKASVKALLNQPAVNAYIEGNEVVYHDFCDISVAVATPTGLVVPVLRDCQTLSFAGVEKAIGQLGKKARDGQLSLEDMSGGTFTISNGGVYGSLFGTPILNPPQSAILGMHGIFDRPIVINGEVQIRPMMYVALTYDHRIVDGREAVTFLKTVKECIEDPTRLLLDL